MEIYFDKSGIMWIGTDKGLCRYDGASAYTLSTDNGLASNHVFAILEDRDHVIWAGGGESGLAKIETTGGIPRVTNIIRRGTTISTVIQDETGTYWIKTSKGNSTDIWRTKHPEAAWELVANLRAGSAAVVNTKGVLYYLPELTQVAAVKNLKTRVIDNLSKNDTALLQASNSKVALFASSESRIYNPDGSYYHINMPESSGGLGFYGRYLSDGNRDIFYRTLKGNIVFENGKFKCRLNLSPPETTDFFYYIAADVYHRLYISHFGKGILQWRSPYITKYDINEKIGRIRETAAGIVFNTVNSVYTYEYNNRSPGKLYQFGVQVIASDESGLPLIVSNDSLKFINRKAFGEPHSRVYDIGDAIYFDHSYYITSYSTGLHRITNFRVDTGWKTSLTGSGLERLKEFDKHIYITTLSKGLFIVDPASRSVRNINQQNGLISNAVYDVYKENDTVWIATNKGVSKVNSNNSLLYNEQAGFIGKRAICVFKDRQKRLWVLSDNMLHLAIGKTLFAIRSHPILTDENSYINSAYYDDRVDKLWVGTNEQLLQVKMDAIQPEKGSYPLVAGEIIADDKLLSPVNHSLVLNHDIQKLEIHFLNPHIGLYSRPDMYYRLTGYNREWERLNQQQIITFQQLPPGKYVLETKSIGPDIGYHVNPNQLAIRILQPWYLRPWFIALCFLFLIVACLLISRVVTKRKYHAQIRKLQAEQALEMERIRISRELHDNVGSMLTVVINRLSDNPITSPNEQQNITSIARNTMSKLRDTIWALDKPSLTATEWEIKAREFIKQLPPNHIEIDASFNFDPGVIITPLKALHSFRILQEACINAIKHSQAKQITIACFTKAENLFEIKVSDDGIGFDVDNTPTGYGIKNMQKRALEMGGAFYIDRNPGGGTVLMVQWPL